jgi:hypothetical protein
MRARRTKSRIGLMAVAATALLAAGAIGASAAGPTGGGGAIAGQVRGTGAGTASPTESVFVPITPCRIVNTQNSAGAIDAGELRSYKTNGNTSEQGGAAACGIPLAATALELSVSAVAATGPGFLRLHPAGVATPTATFLNYGPGQNITNAGTVAIRPGGDQTNLSVRAFENDTHVVIDVLGYYMSELFAAVDVGPILARHNGVEQLGNPNAGLYVVVFDRNISGCAYVVSPGSMSTTGGTHYDVTVRPLTGTSKGVAVQTYADNGGFQNRPFYLVVDC